jgi:hypothetical protein
LPVSTDFAIRSFAQLKLAAEGRLINCYDSVRAKATGLLRNAAQVLTFKPAALVGTAA